LEKASSKKAYSKALSVDNAFHLFSIWLNVPAMFLPDNFTSMVPCTRGLTMNAKGLIWLRMEVK